MKNHTLYHISRHQLDKTILYPRIPKGNMMKILQLKEFVFRHPFKDV